MHIIEIRSLHNGAHRNMKCHNELFFVPPNWSETAIIPDDIIIPSTFPFVDIEVEEKTYFKSVPSEDGQFVDKEYTMLTVIKMTDGVVPEFEEPSVEPTKLDRIEAQATYTAMMTDTLLEE